MTPGNSYSPSQTTLYMQCPREWWYSRRLGLQRKWISKGSLTAAVGVEIGDRIEAYHMLKDPVGQSRVFESELAKYRQCEQPEPSEVTRFKALCNKGMEAYRRSLVKPDGKALQVIDTQVNVGIGHDCFIDMVVKDTENGDIFLWDTKCKLTLTEQDVPRRLAEYQQSWQMLHYGYFYWRKHGQIPKGYMIGLLGLQPKTKLYGGTSKIFPYHHEQLLNWYDSAKFWWSAMDQCLENKWAPMSNHCHRGWGKCEMFDVCHTYRGNVLVAKQRDYIQIGPRA